MNPSDKPHVILEGVAVPVTDLSCPSGATPAGTYPDVAALTAEDAPSSDGRPGRRCSFSCTNSLVLGSRYPLICGSKRMTIRVIAESGTRYTAELVFDGSKG